MVVEHLPGRLGVEDVAPKDVGASLRKMDVQRRVAGPQAPRLVVDLLPPARTSPFAAGGSAPLCSASLRRSLASPC